MRAGLAIGEDVFADSGYSMLAPSRPGYGRTPVQTGTSPTDFAHITADLCEHLGINDVAAVAGISAGGRTAIAMAARHPHLVSRLILESAVGFLAWPDRRTRALAHVGFNARIEKATWGAIRLVLLFAPTMGLRLMMSGLSSKPTSEVLAGLSDEDRATLVAIFSHLRSGAGFVNDLHGFAVAVAPPESITQPTLVIASRNDAGVPFAHAESFVTDIPRAELVISEADSHFIWFGEDYPIIAEQIRMFLAADHSRP